MGREIHIVDLTSLELQVVDCWVFCLDYAILLCNLVAFLYNWPHEKKKVWGALGRRILLCFQHSLTNMSNGQKEREKYL